MINVSFFMDQDEYESASGLEQIRYCRILNYIIGTIDLCYLKKSKGLCNPQSLYYGTYYCVPCIEIPRNFKLPDDIWEKTYQDYLWVVATGRKNSFVKENSFLVVRPGVKKPKPKPIKVNK